MKKIIIGVLSCFALASCGNSATVTNSGINFTSNGGGLPWMTSQGGGGNPWATSQGQTTSQGGGLPWLTSQGGGDTTSQGGGLPWLTSQGGETYTSQYIPPIGTSTQSGTLVDFPTSSVSSWLSRQGVSIQAVPSFRANFFEVDEYNVNGAAALEVDGFYVNVNDASDQSSAFLSSLANYGFTTGYDQQSGLTYATHSSGKLGLYVVSSSTTVEGVAYYVFAVTFVVIPQQGQTSQYTQVTSAGQTSAFPVDAVRSYFSSKGISIPSIPSFSADFFETEVGVVDQVEMFGVAGFFADLNTAQNQYNTFLSYAIPNAGFTIDRNMESQYGIIYAVHSSGKAGLMCTQSTTTYNNQSYYVLGVAFFVIPEGAFSGGGQVTQMSNPFEGFNTSTSFPQNELYSYLSSLGKAGVACPTFTGASTYYYSAVSYSGYSLFAVAGAYSSYSAATNAQSSFASACESSGYIVQMYEESGLYVYAAVNSTAGINIGFSVNAYEGVYYLAVSYVAM